MCGRRTTDQDWGSHEEVIEGVVQQVDAGGRVEICITHQLAGKQRLPGAAAQEAAHLPVRHVHSVGQHLQKKAATTSAKQPGKTPETQPLSLADVSLLVSGAIIHFQTYIIIILIQVLKRKPKNPALELTLK